jgi:hypothetical protein
MEPPAADRHVTYAVGILVSVAAVLVAVNIKPIPLAAEVKVTADPAGAEIWVDGRLEGRAPLQAYVNPGQHKFESRALGYEPSGVITQTFEDGGSGFVNIKLTPIPAALQIVSDLTSGSLRLEGVSNTEILPREGNLALRLPVATRAIELASGSIRVVAPVEIKPAAMPELNGSVLTANARVVALAWGAGKAFLTASYSPVDVYIDDKLAANLISEGKLLASPLSPGPHKVRLVSGGQVFERPVHVAEVPGIALLISAEQNLGNLIVRTNVEGAQIYLDDAEFRASSAVGENFIGNLRVRTVMVSVRKPGFTTPDAKPVQLRRGETVEVSFDLKAEEARPLAAPANQ